MYVVVWASPGAKKERVLEREDGSLDIAVKEPAERNLANTRIRELVAKHYGAQSKSARIISGHRSGKKVISIEQ